MSVAQDSSSLEQTSATAPTAGGGSRATLRARLSAPFRRRSTLSPEAIEARRKAARSGLPRQVDPSMPWPKQILTSRLFWLGVLMLIVYACCLVLLYLQVVPDREVPGGTLIGLGEEAVPMAAKYAAITAIPLSLLFLWADRFKPQRFFVWLLAFGWGACVATTISAQVNTWAAGHLSIIGDGDPATGARAAIYVAPFVEEATKGSVLFWLVILMRYNWVSRVSGIALAGLAGAGFAFVENILYYGRVYRYAASNIGVEPEQALQQLFFQRGVLTFFGHPLFTAMIGIGLAIAVRNKSKVVRVVAPLAGFLAAAFLHMAFNTVATMVSGLQLLLIYLFVALPALAAMIIFVIRQLLSEGKKVRARLTDYARLGWLPEEDVLPMSRLRTRLRAIWQSIFLGWHSVLATVKVQRAETELAYLRDSIARGLVDDAGLQREKVLLARVRAERGAAVIQPAPKAAYGRVKAQLRIRRRKPAESYAPPSYPGPAGLGGNLPAPGTAPIGPAATQYSKVDPNWKPPS